MKKKFINKFSVESKNNIEEIIKKGFDIFYLIREDDQLFGTTISNNSSITFVANSPMHLLFRSNNMIAKLPIVLHNPSKVLDFKYQYKANILNIDFGDFVKFSVRDFNHNRKFGFLYFNDLLKVISCKKISLIDTYSYKEGNFKIELDLDVDIGLLFKACDNKYLSVHVEETFNIYVVYHPTKIAFDSWFENFNNNNFDNQLEIFDWI